MEHGMCGAAPESEQLCACGLVNSPIVLLRLANCAPSASPDVLQRRHGDRNLVANSCITAIACAHSHVPAEAARAPKSCALAWHQRQAEQRPGGCMSPNVSACRQMTLFSPETRARNGRRHSDRSSGADVVSWVLRASARSGSTAAHARPCVVRGLEGSVASTASGHHNTHAARRFNHAHCIGATHSADTHHALAEQR